MSTGNIHSVKNATEKEICIELPPRVNTNGFWSDKNDENPEGLLRNSVPELQLQMLVAFCMSQTFHYILKRFGMSRLTSEIITGLILTYMLSDQKGNPINEKLLSPAGQHILGTLTLFGYSLFMFITATKMNVGMVRKTGSKAATLGIVAVMVPFTLGLFTFRIVGHRLSRADQDRIPFVFITQSYVYFPVVATLLTDLKIPNSELGRLALSAAMIGDILSLVLSNVFLIRSILAGSVQKGVVSVIGMCAYLIFVTCVFKPTMHLIIKKTPEGRPVKDVYVYSIIVFALVTSLYFSFFDEQVYLGPYILGLAIPDGPPLGSAIVEKLECFVTGVFLPLFVSTSVLRVDFAKDNFGGLIQANVIIMAMMHISKFVACLTVCFFNEMPKHDSWALSFIMTSKGIVEIALYTYYKDNNQMDDGGTYNLLIYLTLVISVIVPVTVKQLYDPARKYAGYQKRNIMHMKPNSELRIVVCIHKSEDIGAAIDLIEASCATKESPIGLYVLHLIELYGRASPLFIAHQSQKPSGGLSSVSYSQNVVLSFNRLENSHWGSVKVSAFTAVSPPKLMHEDICTLALDRLASLVLLPFHRKWSPDGAAVESEDKMVRALNTSVLERAPCSVAILVNRSNGGTSANKEGYLYTICVVFLGGKDDREGLTYAKRMAGMESGVHLTVIRFVGPEDVEEEEAEAAVTVGEGEWETVMDAEVLKEVKFSGLNGQRRVTYVEETVVDGLELAAVVKGLVDEYDLVIAGRTHPKGCRHLAGLDLAWTEFPELGVIGDLLASKDVYGKASVLVVQQQTTN